MNKKNKPVPDMGIDENEAAIVREIFHLLVNKGYGTVRVANYLNDKGIKTKRDKGPWRGTAIRALIDIGADYSVSIRFRISMKQYTGEVA